MSVSENDTTTEISKDWWYHVQARRNGTPSTGIGILDVRSGFLERGRVSERSGIFQAPSKMRGRSWRPFSPNLSVHMQRNFINGFIPPKRRDWGHFIQKILTNSGYKHYKYLPQSSVFMWSVCSGWNREQCRRRNAHRQIGGDVSIVGFKPYGGLHSDGWLGSALRTAISFSSTVCSVTN